MKKKIFTIENVKSVFFKNLRGFLISIGIEMLMSVAHIADKLNKK